MNQDKLQARLKWQFEQERFTEDLVLAAQKTIKAADMKRLSDREINTQLSNLLNVALETNSVAVVENWVRYQMGRPDTRRVWKDTKLGNEVIKQFKQIIGFAEKATKTAFSADATKDHVRSAIISMVRLYVGYLRRAYIASKV